jgi:hypothetical protein
LIFQNHYNIKLTFVKKRKEYLMKKMRLKKTMVYTLIILSIPCFLFASDPANTFTFQGVLQDSDGVPISSTVNMVFKIYDSSDNILWTETKPVQIISGEFHLLLGKSVSNPIGFTVNEQARYIGVAVDGDPEMSPRQEVGGVLRAGVALSVTDNAITASKIADNAITSDKIGSNAITSAKISNSSVTAGKLSASGGSTLSNGTSGQALLSNGDGTFSWGTASDFIIVPIQQQVFRASTYNENLSTGTHNYTISPDDIYIKLVLVAGGAGGGGGETSRGGGGGGAGGAIEVFLLKGTHFTSGDVLSFSGGAAGDKGLPVNQNGASGSNTIAYKNGSEICRANAGLYGSNAGGWIYGGSGGTATIAISAPYVIYRGGDGAPGNQETSTVSHGGVGGHQIFMGWGLGGKGGMGRSDGAYDGARDGVQGGAFLIIYRKVSL